jgi:hypothetical protein
MNNLSFSCIAVSGKSSTKSYKTDPYLITDKIVHPLDSSSNLCMFYALFNALRSTELRIAFSGGKMSDPSYHFVERIKHLGMEHHERALEDGYNERDMGFYLSWLKNSGHIKSYTWTRQRKKRKYRLTHIIDRNQKHMKPMIYLCCGIAVEREKRDGIAKKFKKGTHDITHEDTKKLTQVEIYENVSDEYRGEDWAHGAAVAIEDDGKIYIYTILRIKRDGNLRWRR